MKTITKALLGTVAASAAAMISAAPAVARDHYGYGYGSYDTSRMAVEQCMRAAEQTANRYSYGGNARVTDIRDINRYRDGYEIKGRLAVNTRNPYWRTGWGNDWRGWHDRYRGYDSGKFTCRVSYGRIVDLDFDGIRGLH